MRRSISDQAPAPEVVKVISACRLIDSTGVEWLYWRRDGHGLAPGFYVATRASDDSGGPFGINAEFDGPFAQQAAAEVRCTGSGPLGPGGVSGGADQG